MWDKGIDINPHNETSYATHYQQAFLKYVATEYLAKYVCLPIIKLDTVPSNNLILASSASRSGQSSLDPQDLSSNEES